MDFLSSLFESELFASVALVAVPWLVARAFTWVKAELRRRRAERYTAAVEALEVGVHEAWERFGRAWKRARAGSGGKLTGKLSDEEREHLRTIAREVAEQVGGARGVDVRKTLGERALGLLIKKIVERRKRGG